MLAELPLEHGPPWHQLEAETIIDHGEPARRQRDTLAIGSGDVVAFARRAVREPGLGRELGYRTVQLALAQSVQEIVGENDALPLAPGQALFDQLIDTAVH